MRWLGLVALGVALGGCQQGQVSESNQATVTGRAMALEKAADASVNESIVEIAREEPAAPVADGNVGKAQ